MKLFTFGDSWTEGVGGDLTEEYQTNIPEERTKIRHKYCWPKYLSDLLKIEFQNFGMGGASNKVIFDAACHAIHNNIIKKDDIVVVMWSSSLRDSVPFFPSNNHWHFWGETSIRKKHIYGFILDKTHFTKSDNQASLKKEYKEYFIDNLFSETYYDIINQNYILYIQYMFDRIGIRYVFCDAFDLMIKKEIIKEVDKTNLIKTNHYWGLSDKTIKDFLISKNRKDVWEDGNLWSNNIIGKHPNKIGYELIANMLYDYILEKDILYYNTNEIKNRII